MSARDKLRACFPALPAGSSNDLIERAVDEILNDHAHELAEKQRAERDRQYGPLEFKAEKIVINRVIDLIDPEA